MSGIRMGRNLGIQRRRLVRMKGWMDGMDHRSIPMNQRDIRMIFHITVGCIFHLARSIPYTRSITSHPSFPSFPSTSYYILLTLHAKQIFDTLHTIDISHIPTCSFPLLKNILNERLASFITAPNKRTRSNV